MDNLNLVLWDGPWRDHLLPLTFTRPVAELRCGILTIREKWEHDLHTSASWFTAPYLREKFPVKKGSSCLVVNASCCPDTGLLEAVRALSPGEGLSLNGEWLAIMTKGDNIPAPSTWDDSFRAVPYSGEVRLVTRLWDMLDILSLEMQADFERITSGRASAPLPAGIQVIGNGEVFLEPDARILASDINTEDGPVYFGKSSLVMEGCLIRGPFSLGSHGVLKMGTRIYGPVAFGPYSKVAGEVNHSIITGYSNKAHDGFLGHAILGEWCNLGADTNNSNLKNNYAPVQVWNYALKKHENTGRQFCGLFMGDHSKCGINTMFNTGTVVGVFANIFGSGFPPTFVPSFTWGGIGSSKKYIPEAALKVAARVMARRNLELTSADRAILKQVFELTRIYRNVE